MRPSEARTAVLGRIGAALRSEEPKSIQNGDETASLPAPYVSTGELDTEARLALFTERLREYDAQVIATTPEDLAQTLAALLQAEPDNEATGLNAQPAQPKSSPLWVIAEGFPADWLRPSSRVCAEAEADLLSLDQAAGVVTTCTVAIAITGTLVLTHGAGEGQRRTTLVPDRHVCVVRSSQVVETVPEAFARLAELATRPITFISGPSATADIEMTRIRGVHGPRHLTVVLVREP